MNNKIACERNLEMDRPECVRPSLEPKKEERGDAEEIYFFSPFRRQYIFIEPNDVIIGDKRRCDDDVIMFCNL